MLKDFILRESLIAVFALKTNSKGSDILYPYVTFEVDMDKKDSALQKIYTRESIRKIYVPVIQTNIHCQILTVDIYFSIRLPLCIKVSEG